MAERHSSNNVILSEDRNYNSVSNGASNNSNSLQWEQTSVQRAYAEHVHICLVC
jgi:hypothetical protein